MRVDETYQPVNVSTNNVLTQEFKSLRARVDEIKQKQSKSESNLSEFLAKRDNRIKRMISAMEVRISDLKNTARSVEVTEP